MRPYRFQSRSCRLTREISLLPLSGFEASTVQQLPNQYMDKYLFCLWPTSVLLLLLVIRAQSQGSSRTAAIRLIVHPVF
jgi:hypothetical protein